ncbi:hypothetical protein GCM10023222_34920 [Saccharopolyspora cebuensis]
MGLRSGFGDALSAWNNHPVCAFSAAIMRASVGPVRCRSALRGPVAARTRPAFADANLIVMAA